MKMNMYQVIKRPIITEKSTALREQQNQVLFEVDRKATKADVKGAVEALFGVKVAAVNTALISGKPKRSGRSVGRRSMIKKAYVTLRAGEKLELLEAALPADEAEG
jgi:large subunit ribosomal protein L23